MSRRDQIQMTDEEIAAILADRRTLQVASVNADGSPHLVPMWFITIDGDPAFWTYRKSQKIVNLRRDPRITVMVEAGDVYEELRGVSIAGRAEIIDDRDEVLAIGEKIYERYWGPITDESVREGVQVMGAKRSVVVVKAETIASWDHRKLSGTY